jgi:hypothetical protein
MTELFSAEVTSLAPPAIVPDREPARRRLRGIFDELRGAPAWPWGPTIVDLHRQDILPGLYSELEDHDEAELWRARIEGEIARLDACSRPF